VIAGLVAWFFATRGSGRTTVPNVVGMRSQAAAERLHEAHLKDLPTTGASSRPQGVVFAQQPGAGVRVDKNDTVTISISSGAARRPIPDVTDLPEAQATQRLTAAGFAPQVKRVSSKRQKGTVFKQVPTAGVTATKGTTVVVSVSAGVKTVAVPSLVGETQGDAVAQVTKLGLDPMLQDVPSKKPVGEIVAQRPSAGKKIGKGSTVVLDVSSGSAAGTTTVRTTTARTTTARTTTARTTTVRTTSTTSTTVTTGG
jgi:serine/threonine-protein kinase